VANEVKHDIYVMKRHVDHAVGAYFSKLIYCLCLYDLIDTNQLGKKGRGSHSLVQNKRHKIKKSSFNVSGTSAV